MPQAKMVSTPGQGSSEWSCVLPWTPVDGVRGRTRARVKARVRVRVGVRVRVRVRVP